MKLLLIRHGESEGNVKRQWQGLLDVPLTERGREQALRLAERVWRWSAAQEEPLAAVYSSTLARAHWTAEALARRCGAPLVLDKRLCERDLGVLQGLTWPEIDARYPDLAQILRQRKGVPTLPGGESSFEVTQRVWQAIEEITDGHASEANVAVVSHGGSLNAYFNRLTGRGDDVPFIFRLGNTSLSMIEIQDGRTHITLVNSLCHLEQPAV